MNKKDTIQYIERALRIEEAAITIYSSSVESALVFSGLSESKQNKIKSILNVLSKDSQRHKRIFEKMLRYAKGSKKHVF